MKPVVLVRDLRIREHFLTKLFVRAGFHELRTRPSMRGIVQFQADNKLLLMAYNQTEMRKLGAIVANHEKRGLASLLDDYEEHLDRALARPARYTSHVNVLMHTLGYFSKQLTARERRNFLDLLESYRDENVPLGAAIAVCRSWIARFGNDYLERQTYFTPHLDAMTESGEDRGKL